MALILQRINPVTGKLETISTPSREPGGAQASDLIPVGGGTRYSPPNLPSTAADEMVRVFAPERFQQIRSTLGEAPKFEPRPVAPLLETFRPKPIQPRSAEFFQAQKESLKEQLRQEFFGPVGRVQQVASAESAEGRLGSGVGKRIIEQSALQPFAQASVQIDRDILMNQLEEKQRVMELNVQEQDRFNQIVANAMAVDSTNEMEAFTAWSALNKDYTMLSAQIEQAEREGASELDIARMNRDAQIFLGGLDAWTTARGQDITERLERGRLEEEAFRTDLNAIKDLKLDKPLENYLIDRFITGRGGDVDAIWDATDQEDRAPSFPPTAILGSRYTDPRTGTNYVKGRNGWSKIG